MGLSLGNGISLVFFLFVSIFKCMKCIASLIASLPETDVNLGGVGGGLAVSTSF